MGFRLILKGRTSQNNSIQLKKHTVLSIDPGSVNFAYCVTTNGVVVFSAMLKNPINTYTDQNNTIRFIEEFNTILKQHKPNVVVIERFLIRRFLTKLAEFVGIMVGIINKTCVDNKIEYHAITASTWKLSIKKVVDLKQLYKDGKKQYKLPPHQIDSCMIGRYLLSGRNYRPEDKQWILENLPRLVSKV